MNSIDRQSKTLPVACRMNRMLFPASFIILAALLPFLLMFIPKAIVVAFGLVALCAGIDLVRNGGWRYGWDGKILAALTALLVWGLASMLWEETAGLALHKTGQLLGLCLPGLVVVTAAKQLNQAVGRRVVTALCLGFVAVAVLVAIETWFNLPISRFRYGLSAGSSAINITVYKNLAAAGSIFAVPAIGFALLWRRWLMAGAMVAALLACAVLSHSFTALVSLAVIALMALSCLAWRRLPALLLAIALFGGFLAAPLALKIPDTRQVTTQLPWLPPSFVHRSAIWHFVAENAAQRPIMGWGLDAARELPGGDADMHLYATFNGKIIEYNQQILPLHPHNFVMQLWLELGVVGMVLFLALLFVLLGKCAAQPGGIAPVCTAALATPILVGTASYGLWQSWWIACLWLVGALVVALLPKGEAA